MVTGKGRNVLFHYVCSLVSNTMPPAHSNHLMNGIVDEAKVSFKIRLRIMHGKYLFHLLNFQSTNFMTNPCQFISQGKKQMLLFCCDWFPNTERVTQQLFLILKTVKIPNLTEQIGSIFKAKSLNPQSSCIFVCIPVCMYIFDNSALFKQLTSNICTFTLNIL